MVQKIFICENVSGMAKRTPRQQNQGYNCEELVENKKEINMKSSNTKGKHIYKMIQEQTKNIDH